jgi:serine protease Do
MSLIDELQGVVTRIAGDVGASVVGIGNRWVQGSGVVMAPGLVLTNAHNIRSDATTVTFNDGSTGTGTPLGVDPDGDLAVLEVDTGDAPAANWGSDGTAASIGTPVFGLSNPGGRGLRVTFGLVSGTERTFRGPRGRRITGTLEHTAPLLPGSSGGPVVDLEGRLVGINTNRLGEGFYLAIPAGEDLKRRADLLGRGEAPTRPRLGVGLAPAHVARGLRKAVGLPETDGLLVRMVEEGGPAAHAGLQEGDLIVAAGGTDLDSVDRLHDILDNATDRLELTVLRGTEERSVTIEFSESRS